MQPAGTRSVPPACAKLPTDKVFKPDSQHSSLQNTYFQMLKLKGMWKISRAVAGLADLPTTEDTTLEIRADKGATEPTKNNEKTHRSKLLNLSEIFSEKFHHL